MQVLRARLYDLERQRRDAERAADRRGQVGSGDRSERIRTYNFPQGRLTDHRIGLTLYRLDQVMQGDLDEVIAGADRRRPGGAAGRPRRMTGSVQAALARARRRGWRRPACPTPARDARLLLAEALGVAPARLTLRRGRAGRRRRRRRASRAWSPSGRGAGRWRRSSGGARSGAASSR